MDTVKLSDVRRVAGGLVRRAVMVGRANAPDAFIVADDTCGKSDTGA